MAFIPLKWGIHLTKEDKTAHLAQSVELGNERRLKVKSFCLSEILCNHTQFSLQPIYLSSDVMSRRDKISVEIARAYNHKVP
ncbi:MAG TPA: hypothetical protein VJ440_03505 [Candidatus Brocadiaceae bacterium]|nr:hypothetical protein [Candidatus Brocadiaceae bacterium]